MFIPAGLPASYCGTVRSGRFFTAEQLVFKTIEAAQHNIRLMGYSFTSPEVAGALISAKSRGVDVRGGLDWKANTGKNNNASWVTMNLLTSAGIPVRTVSVYKILHDKVIVSDGRHTEVGSFNYSRAADRSNSENVLSSGMTQSWPAAT
ncbi:phospholipase [Salmonella enterica]|nr:phospholipase [Salmonella enterica]EHH0886083.1 phospholipase [Salmonella enterica subsp. enterica serovar Montevideo]EIE6466306.1 phospholipase [Salmonella enterica]